MIKNAIQAMDCKTTKLLIIIYIPVKSKVKLQVKIISKEHNSKQISRHKAYLKYYLKRTNTFQVISNYVSGLSI
jgi:hypothetical protein